MVIGPESGALYYGVDCLDCGNLSNYFRINLLSYSRDSLYRDSLYRTLSIPRMLIVPCQHPDSFECSAMRKRKENPLTEDKSGKKRVCLTLGQKRDVICRLAENKAVPEVAADTTGPHTRKRP